MKTKNPLAISKEQRIETVIAKAAELFLEQDIFSVKMTDVAERSEIGVVSIYRYFGTKQHLVVASACYLWSEQAAKYEGVFTKETYLTKSGFNQICIIFEVFQLLVVGEADFLKFIQKFDAYVIGERIPAEKLEGYERQVMNVFTYFEKAFEKGTLDGSIRLGLHVQRYYRTAAHALMSLSQKLLAGEILQSDREHGVVEEVRMLTEILINYIRE